MSIVYIVVYDPNTNAVIMTNEISQADKNILMFPAFPALTPNLGDNVKKMIKNSDKLSYDYLVKHNNWFIYKLNNFSNFQPNPGYIIVPLEKLYDYDISDYAKRCVNFLHGVYSANTCYSLRIDMTNKHQKMNELKQTYMKHTKYFLQMNNIIPPDKYNNKHIITQLFVMLINYIIYYRFYCVFLELIPTMNYEFNKFIRDTKNVNQMNIMEYNITKLEKIREILNDIKTLSGDENIINISPELYEYIDNIKNYNNEELIKKLYLLERDIISSRCKKAIHDDAGDEEYKNKLLKLESATVDYTESVKSFDTIINTISANLIELEKNMMTFFQRAITTMEESFIRTNKLLSYIKLPKLPTITDIPDAYIKFIQLENSYNEMVQEHQYYLYVYSTNEYKLINQNISEYQKDNTNDINETRNKKINDNNNTTLSIIDNLFKTLQKQIFLDMFDAGTTKHHIMLMTTAKPILINIITQILKDNNINDPDFIRHVDIIFEVISVNNGKITDEIMKSFNYIMALIQPRITSYSYEENETNINQYLDKLIAQS